MFFTNISASGLYYWRLFFLFADSRDAPPIRGVGDVALSEERTVTLILYYVAFMIGGDLAAYFLGLLVEYEWGKRVSLIVFLALYFFFALGRLDARSLGNYAEKCHIKCEMKALWMDPGVRELAALSALAALGCGLAAFDRHLWRRQRSDDYRGGTALTVRTTRHSP